MFISVNFLVLRFLKSISNALTFQNKKIDSIMEYLSTTHAYHTYQNISNISDEDLIRLYQVANTSSSSTSVEDPVVHSETKTVDTIINALSAEQPTPATPASAKSVPVQFVTESQHIPPVPANDSHNAVNPLPINTIKAVHPVSVSNPPVIKVVTEEAKKNIWDVIKSYKMNNHYDIIIEVLPISDTRSRFGLKLLKNFYKLEELYDTWYGDTSIEDRKELEPNRLACIKDLCFTAFPCSEVEKNKEWKIVMGAITNRCRNVRNSYKKKKKQPKNEANNQDS